MSLHCKALDWGPRFTFVFWELGLKYNSDYYRDVQYKTFSDCKTKINCDYVIQYNDKKYYVEIAGMLYTDKDLQKTAERAWTSYEWINSQYL